MNLHPELAADTFHIDDLEVCRVLLMNNQRYPWLILVPMRDGLRELYDLGPTDYTTVMEEIRHAARLFSQLTGADKMNIAALGNRVPQLHIHVIARFTHDPAWPQPVWGHPVPALPYTPSQRIEMLEKTSTLFGTNNITKM